MNTSDVTVELAEHVATVEIHRPPNNFFDTTLIKGIADAYGRLDDNVECRVIVLCAEGKHFCVGADFSRPVGDGSPAGELYIQAIRLFRASKPVVAAIQGAAIGGGLGLALSADFRVASPSSRFAANFSQLGFHPGFGITVTLPRVVGQQKALEWLLIGQRFDGEKAYAAGLVDELASDGEVRAAALRFAERIAASAPLALRASAGRCVPGSLTLLRQPQPTNLVNKPGCRRPPTSAKASPRRRSAAPRRSPAADSFCAQLRHAGTRTGTR
jgi:enoyl-CoA hydratase/carnithine racemase